jgi:AraC-like DNA-binding protein
MLAQGSKRLSLGGESYVYDPGTYLLVSQHLPVSGQVLDASPERPYLALRLDYDINELASLIAGTGMKGPSSRQPPPRGIMTAEVQPALLDPVLRLVRLLDSPEDIEALAPLTIREILYRLLAGPCGAQLAQFTLTDSASHRVARAIDWLREHYNEPLELDTMAGMVHLSASTLRAHFKAATAMSPMQYQKNLRLQEARRMLIAERLDAATACHKIGYGSASQFSREYSRMFGAPPARDVRRFREHQRGEGLPPPVV